MMPTACVDASVAIKWYLPEEHQEQAWAILAAFENGELDLVAPDLIVYEIDSILRGRIARRELSAKEAAEVLRQFLDAGIELVRPEEIAESALSIATKLGIWTYDAAYLATAQLADGDLWTADDKLRQQAAKQLTRVRRLGEP